MAYVDKIRKIRFMDKEIVKQDLAEIGIVGEAFEPVLKQKKQVLINFFYDRQKVYYYAGTTNKVYRTYLNHVIKKDILNEYPNAALMVAAMTDTENDYTKDNKSFNEGRGYEEQEAIPESEEAYLMFVEKSQAKKAKAKTKEQE